MLKGNFSNLIADEILPAIVSGQLTFGKAMQFSMDVLDRNKNPFIEHRW